MKDSSCNSGTRTIEVNPDLLADFTSMPFDDNSFAMVVFDPPHLASLGHNSWMAIKYGTLIFKWNECEIKASQVLDAIPYKPLFGHTTGRQGKTIWMTFMKGVSDREVVEPPSLECRHLWVYKIYYDHSTANVCEICHLIQENRL